MSICKCISDTIFQNKSLENFNYVNNKYFNNLIMTMSNKSAFANNYEDFSDAISSSFLNESKDGISESFKTTLNKFKDTKLHHLKSKMGKDIFYDGSVYTGSAGLALYYFMLGIRKPGSHEHLKTALEYIDLNSLKGKRISFLCGDAGPLAIATVISYKLGNKRPHTLPEYNTLVDRLLSLASLISSSPDEILYGKSGYLYALLFVNKHVPEKSLIPAKHFEKVISSILNSGRQLSAEINSESPMMWQWHEKIYFGAAHGMAGILYMLLQARTYMTDADLHNLVKPTINWLLKQRFSSGNFPSSMGSGSGDRLVQWCHGAPGFVSLCTLAAEVFKEDKYLKIAQKSCDVVWERGLCTKGYSICHGVSGNAYAFLQMYQATMEPMYLYRACCFMEWCVLERKGTELHAPDRPASMFEGLVGRLYLAEDVTQAFNARFPAYSLE